MEITWFGHSCFRIKGKDAVVVIDPCSSASGYSTGKIQADIVAISHPHDGHSCLEDIQGPFKAIKGPGEYEIKGVYITGTATYHDDAKGTKSGKNTIYTVEMEGVTLCHLGDLGHTLSPETVGDLGSVNVLFVPVGGHSTIGATVAADLVRNINPGFVIPMHYKTDLEKKDLEFCDKFLKEMGIKESPVQPKLIVTKTNIPSATQVVVLDYPRG